MLTNAPIQAILGKNESSSQVPQLLPEDDETLLQ
jgi:hypothetical protein